MEAARRVRAARGDVAFLIAGTPDVGNPDVGARRDGPAVARLWLLAETDVLAVSTYYPEGIPRILLEGAAAGCGLVASDTDGCREVVDHGRNGLLVSPQDPDSQTGGMCVVSRWSSTRRGQATVSEESLTGDL